MLQFLHGTPFGLKDAIFGKDIGFYIFGLPFWKFLYGELLDLLLLCLSPQRPPATLSGTGRTHASSARRSRHLTIWHPSGGSGLGAASNGSISSTPPGDHLRRGYTDIHAELPALNVLAAISHSSPPPPREPGAQD